jgi:hypothetical protein
VPDPTLAHLVQVRSSSRQRVLDALNEATTFLRSRHLTELGMVRSLDESRQVALEQLDGLQGASPLITHTRRPLSERDRIERLRQDLLFAIESLRSPEEGRDG